MSATMQAVDLSQLHSRSLEPLFQQEIRRWQEELYWDYRPSVELIRKFIDSRALGGFAAIEDGRPTGYGFYVVEDQKGLIGGLFVSPQCAQGPTTQKLLDEMLGSLRTMPHLGRIEAQLMPFGSELDPALLSQYFRLYPRQFMLLNLPEAKLSGKALSPGVRLEAWTDKAFEPAARLIHLAYADHVDSQINDQYRSVPGGLKFLRNIVLLPGCGKFMPEASFLMRSAVSDNVIGMVLTSTVAEGVGHTTQLCVMPGHQGQSVGRQLIENSILALRRKNYERLSLTVTSVNQRAVDLYEHLGFRSMKKFAAGVWQA